MNRLWRGITEWLSQVWTDIKASTDPALLGVARFFGLLYGPIDTSLPIDQALRKSLAYRLPRHATWRNALGGVAYLLFLLLVVTGVLLVVYYRPSAQEAFPSVQYIVSGVTLGWLIRDVHVWSASLLVVMVLAHMARVFFAAAYKPPRETNWLIGILLLFVVLAFGATGYLLAWDQSAYWTVTGALNALEGLPLLGGIIVELVRADPIVSGATLSRFFAMHVVVLPWFALGLLGFHFTMVRRHGIAPPPDGAADPGPGRRFFPNHLMRSYMVGVTVLALVITIAILAPRQLGTAALPGQLPDRIISTWIVVDVSRALVHYLGGGYGFALFSLLGLALALLPLFDRNPERSIRRRPLAAAIGLTFFLGFIGLWLAGRSLRTVPLTPAAVEQPATPLPAPAPSPATDSATAGGQP